MAKVLKIKRDDFQPRNRPDTGWLTTGEVARVSKLTSQRIQAKLRAGHFPSAKVCECGRTFLIKRKEVEQWLNG